MIRAIAFDFDGVLVESVAVKTNAFAQLFSEEDPEAVQKIIDFHLRHCGTSRFEKIRAIYREILHRPLAEEKLQSLCEQFSSYVVDRVIGAPWVEGAVEFLAGHAGWYECFVISGTPQEELREIISRRGIATFFREVLGAPSSKETLLGDTLRRHSLAPSEAVFVGDAETDWLAAREAGIQFVWRQASADMPWPSGFSGPRISSLAELDTCLSDLQRVRSNGNGMGAS